MVYETKFILIALTILLIIYDIYCYLNFGIDSTLHRAVLSLGQYHPVIYLVIGTLSCVLLIRPKD